MYRKWPMRWLALPATIVLMGCLAWLLLPAPSKGVRAAYNRIKVGMDLRALDVLMLHKDFPQSSWYTASNGNPVMTFYSPGGTITLTLNRKRQVATKAIDDSWLTRVGYYLD